MKTLHSYIAREIIKQSLMIMIVLTSVFFLFELLKELSFIGIKSYDLEMAIVYLLMHIPSYAYTLAPLSVLMGVILAIGKLNETKELQIIFSAGISYKALNKVVLFICFFISIAIFLFAESSAFSLTQFAQNFKNELLEKKISINSIQKNVWIKEGDSFFLIGKIDNHQLEGVTEFQVINNNLDFIKHSPSGNVKTDQLEFDSNDGYTLSFEKLDSLVRLAKTGLSEGNNLISINPSVLSLGILKPWDLNILDLYAHTNVSEESKVDVSSYKVEFYNRIYMPLVTLTLVYLTLPFLFNTERNNSLGARIFLGFGLGLGALIFIQFSNIVSLKYNFNHLIFGITPILLLLTSNYIFRKLRKT